MSSDTPGIVEVHRRPGETLRDALDRLGIVPGVQVPALDLKAERERLLKNYTHLDPMYAHQVLAALEDELTRRGEFDETFRRTLSER